MLRKHKRQNCIRNQVKKHIVILLTSILALQSITIPIYAQAATSVQTPTETTGGTTTEVATQATAEAITEATTQATAEAITEATSEATTEATSEATTEATSEATTEDTSEITTEATTETTSETTTKTITEAKTLTADSLSEDGSELHPYKVDLSEAAQNIKSYGEMPIPGYEAQAPQESGDYYANSYANSSLSLPASYDARTAGYVTPIKNQGFYGTCWSFSSMAAMESSLLSKGETVSSTPDYSERHLEYFQYNEQNDLLSNTAGDYTTHLQDPDWYDASGNTLLSMWTLLNWKGAADENTAPYANIADIDGSRAFTDLVHLQNVSLIPDGDLSGVKEAIYTQGAITASVLWPKNSKFLGSNGYSLFTPSYFSGTNHSITLVGWDDSYSKSNFNTITYNGTTYAPESDGAFLIKNSWGTYSGDSGYYWVSYEDACLSNFVSFDCETADNYDHNFYYDGSTGFSYRSIGNGGSAANVFMNTTGKAQRLSAVGLGIYSASTSYSVQIYKNPTAGNPSSGTAMLTTPATGANTYGGYVTVALGEDVIILPGETFSVVAQLTKTSGSPYIFTDVSDTWDWVSFTTTQNSGQSFYKTSSGSWNDLYSRGATARIKAYTNDCAFTLVDAEEQLTLVNHAEKFPTLQSNVLLEDENQISGIIYTSSDTSVAEVSETGLITGKKPGKSIISVAYGGVTQEIYVSVSADLSDASIQTTEDAVYTGQSVCPQEKVYYTIAGKEIILTCNVDYKTAYKNNIKCSQEAVLLVNGIDNCSGTGQLLFEIIPQDISNMQLSLRQTQYTYSGQECKPVVTVKFGSRTLSLGTDYTVTYVNAIDAGEAENLEEPDTSDPYAQITGTGTVFSGTKKLGFSIVPGDINKASATLSKTNYRINEYTEEELSSGITPVETVKDTANRTLSKGMMVKGEQYSVEYRDNTKRGYATVVLSGTGNYCGTKELPYFIEGENISKIKFEGIPTQEIEVDATGEIQRSEPEITALTDGVSFSTTYIDNQKVGRAYAYVYGTEAYSGQKRLSFNIRAASLTASNTVIGSKTDADSGKVISGITTCTYNGMKQTPQIKLAYLYNGTDQYIMQQGTDYTIRITNNIDASNKALVTITGRGKFRGTLKQEFTIAPLNISENVSSINGIYMNAVTYTGRPVTLNPRLSYTNDSDKKFTMQKNKDYTITQTGNRTGVKGENTKCAYSITGCGNYTGTISDSYTIASRYISRLRYSLKSVRRYYTGTPYTIGAEELTVKDGSTVLTQNEDYLLQLTNNTDAGMASILVKDANSDESTYAGMKTLSFRILQKTMKTGKDATVSIAAIDDSHYWFSGEAYCPKPVVTDPARNTVLIEDTDYKVTYSNNIRAGKATIRIRGIGNYNGTVTANFTIQEGSFENLLVVPDTDIRYNGKPVSFKAVVSYYPEGESGPQIILKEKTAYRITCKNNRKATTEDNKAEYTLIPCGTWSNMGARVTGTYDIAKGNLDTDAVIRPISNQTYKGKTITPRLTVRCGNVTLRQNVDYYISENLSANQRGIATIVIQGMGNYKGSLTAKYNIL